MVSISFGILFLKPIKSESHVTDSSLLAKYAPSQACKCLGMYALVILPTGTVKISANCRYFDPVLFLRGYPTLFLNNLR